MHVMPIHSTTVNDEIVPETILDQKSSGPYPDWIEETLRDFVSPYGLELLPDQNIAGTVDTDNGLVVFEGVSAPDEPLIEKLIHVRFSVRDPGIPDIAARVEFYLAEFYDKDNAAIFRLKFPTLKQYVQIRQQGGATRVFTLNV